MENIIEENKIKFDKKYSGKLDIVAFLPLNYR
jgi:hypothetical protein